MKTLVIDIGNTRLKYGIYNGNKTIVTKAIATKGALAVLKKDITKHKPAFAIIADVTGKAGDVKVLKGITITAWGKKLKLPIKNRYKSVTLGQDRLALAAGGHTVFPKNNVLVISAGTCITYEFINSKGEYLGGAISPGLNMRGQAMQHFTAKLPFIKPERKFKVTGNTTQSSLLSGVMNGAMQEIKGIIAQYRLKYPDLKVILTGGDAQYFETELKNEIFAHPYLALTGLNSILQLNAREA